MGLIRRIKARAAQSLVKAKSIVIRELHTNATPQRAALSLAFGILVGFSPFYGLHALIALPLAFLFRLNRPLTLLAMSITSPPIVFFWIMAGIFSGKIVISIDKAHAIVVAGKNSAFGSLFDTVVSSLVGFLKKVFPADLFEKIVQGSTINIEAKLLQWFFGCLVLAVVSAIATWCMAYPIFLYVNARRKRRRAAGESDGTGAILPERRRHVRIP
jgi:uncharacterized protein (DUF2062 family)